jgi:hypothetical protein
MRPPPVQRRVTADDDSEVHSSWCLAARSHARIESGVLITHLAKSADGDAIAWCKSVHTASSAMQLSRRPAPRGEHHGVHGAANHLHVRVVAEVAGIVTTDSILPPMKSDRPIACSAGGGGRHSSTLVHAVVNLLPWASDLLVLEGRRTPLQTREPALMSTHDGARALALHTEERAVSSADSRDCPISKLEICPPRSYGWMIGSIEASGQASTRSLCRHAYFSRHGASSSLSLPRSSMLRH